MNSFLFSAITICLAAQCALANYNNNNQYQRKLAPSPQTYGQQASGYGESAGYGAGHGASVSSYDERTPAAGGYRASGSAGGYARGAASGYGQQAASGYGQQAASGYAKAAPRYEETYSAPMPFAWGYDINDGYGGAQYHKENGDEYGKRTGSYGYTDAYGVYRQVDYVADEHGFRATIKTNEPGTSNESPADVEMHAYEPPSNFYAGNRDSGYSSGKAASYAQAQPTSSGYGAQAVVATYAPAAASGYGAASKGYSQQASSYGRAASGYQQPARASGYSQQAEQYSSSVLVPVYQRSSLVGKPLAAAPAKRY